MDSFQPIGNVTANETDTAYALRAIGQSLSETESETIELRSSLQKLLNSDDNLGNRTFYRLKLGLTIAIFR